MTPTRIAGAVALAFVATASHAATYYANSASTAATPDGSASKPWKTLASVNAAPLQPQDIVLLQCGSIWEETLAPKAGVIYKSSTDNCTNKPVIRGSAAVGALTWTRDSGTNPVYWADVSSLGSNPITQLFADGQRLQRARHPNIVRTGGVITSRYARMADTNGGDLYAPNFPSNAFTAEQQGAIATEGWLGAKLYSNFNGYAVMRHTAQMLDGALKWRADPESPTWYAGEAKIGAPNTPYWVENKRWMLDSAGEWFHDTAQKRLYVYMPNGLSPQGNATLRAAIRPYGIESHLIGGFTVNNVEVRETAHDAVYIDKANTVGSSARFLLTKLTVAFAGNRGIYVLGGTNGGVTYSSVTDTMAVPISIGDFLQKGLTTGDGIDVSNNVVTRAGEQFFAVAGIKGGRSAVVIGNEVSEMPGMGIVGDRGSWLTSNKISQVCKSALDCGAIYVVGEDLSDLSDQPLQVNVGSNQIDGVLSATDGLLQGEAALGGVGIYADDFSTSVQITNNTVTNAGTGILLHYARNTTISGNVLSGNRITQIKILEADPSGKDLSVFCAKPYAVGDGLPCGHADFVAGNLIKGNYIVSTNANAGLVQQDTEYASTADFATYEDNTYVSASPKPFLNIVRGQPGWTALSFSRWKNQLGNDATSQYRANLALPAATPTALTIADFGTAGWQQWDGSLAQAVAGPTAGSTALEVDATGASGSGLFSKSTSTEVDRGATYAMRFDARLVGATAGSINFMIGSVSGGAYHPSTDVATVELSDQWRSYEIPLSAWKSASTSVHDEGGTLGRLDFLDLGGKKLQFANARLTKSVRTIASQSVVVYHNRTGGYQTYQCPASNLCTQYVDAKTGAAVAFPLTLANAEKKVVVLAPRPGKDTDDDGVEDGRENAACQATPWNQSVNNVGCVALSAP